MLTAVSDGGERCDTTPFLDCCWINTAQAIVNESHVSLKKTNFHGHGTLLGHFDGYFQQLPTNHIEGEHHKNTQSSRESVWNWCNLQTWNEEAAQCHHESPLLCFRQALRHSCRGTLKRIRHKSRWWWWEDKGLWPQTEQVTTKLSCLEML